MTVTKKEQHRHVKIVFFLHFVDKQKLKSMKTFKIEEYKILFFYLRMKMLDLISN